LLIKYYPSLIFGIVSIVFWMDESEILICTALLSSKVVPGAFGYGCGPLIVVFSFMIAILLLLTFCFLAFCCCCCCWLITHCGNS